MMIRPILTIAAALGLLAISAGLAGCSDTATQQTIGPTPTAAVSPIEKWKAQGTLRDVGSAIDGNLNTAASAAPGSSNAVLTIDLGKMSLFNMAVIEHGPRPQAFARRVSVLTSPDGENFTLVHTSPGTPRKTYISILTPVLARYVRFQAILGEDRPWSVAEIYFQ
jgi:hypothetical protein